MSAQQLPDDTETIIQYLDLFRASRQESLHMLELNRELRAGIENMHESLFERTNRLLDTVLDLGKFFITIGSAGVFAYVAIPHEMIGSSTWLLTNSIWALIGGLILLFFAIHKKFTEENKYLAELADLYSQRDLIKDTLKSVSEQMKTEAEILRKLIDSHEKFIINTKGEKDKK